MRACPSLLVVLIALSGCRRPANEIGPTPEPQPPVLPTPPEGPVAIAGVHCTYGGTVPAFFVWFDLEARVSVRKLRGLGFTLPDDGADAAFADAVERRIGWGVLSLRTRARTDAGLGEIGAVPDAIAAGERLHLELFGPLRTSVFGAGETYPTEERTFRAEIEAEGIAPLSIEGTCTVGPSG